MRVFFGIVLIIFGLMSVIGIGLKLLHFILPIILIYFGVKLIAKDRNFNIRRRF